MSVIQLGFLRPLPGALAAVGVLLAAGPALAQRAPLLRHLADVKGLPGTVVAQAKMPSPETALGIIGYRVEHVALPGPVRVSLQGRTQEVSEGWHVTVAFARPLTVRDQAFSLVIDGRWCGFLQEAPDLKSADTVCFDGELIRDQAALGVTYRSIEMASRGAEAERLLGPEAALAGAGEALHYASVRLSLQEAR
jgi:hypothetical protein